MVLTRKTALGSCLPTPSLAIPIQRKRAPTAGLCYTVTERKSSRGSNTVPRQENKSHFNNTLDIW